MFHMDLGLGRVGSALAALGLDRPPYISAQVAGTNGKGSTSTFLATALQAAGLTTGLYTSPHFLSPKERIQVDGRQLPDRDWLDAAEAVLRVSQDVSPLRRLTYFELLTVMAAWLFRESGCRAAVFEAGLGGSHDATTALRHELTVFTPIGLDHSSILGPTIRDIARDKALAMRPGVPAVTGPQEPEAMDALVRAAARAGAVLHRLPEEPEQRAGQLPASGTPAGSFEPGAALCPDGPVRLLPRGLLPTVTPSMPGPHQAENFRLAAGAALLLSRDHGLNLDAHALERAAREAFIPGRMQVIAPDEGGALFVLDGAHNQPGLICLKNALESLSLEPSAMVFACLGDKDVEAMLPLARSLTEGPVYVPPMDAPGRALDPDDLAMRLGPRARAVTSVAEALDLAGRAAEPSGGPVLVCGSLYLLGEVYRLRPEWLEKRPGS